MDNLALGTMEVELDGDVLTINMDALLAVDPDDLSRQFSGQAAAYAYVATMSARAEGVLSVAKKNLEDAKARADGKWRNVLAARHDKVTEAMVSNAVLLDTEVQRVTGAMLEANQTWLLLRSLERAMNMRSEMLISLGATLRQEANQTGMSINSRAAAPIQESYTESVGELLRANKRS